jgi:CheY-like chemotaxis protein
MDGVDGQVLVVDDDAEYRAAIVGQLRLAGCGVLEAPDYDVALQLFRSCADVQLVILDHPTGAARVDGLVANLRAIRQDATIVGNSGADRRVEFAAAGVPLFLQKPWRPADLATLLRGGISTCGECSSPLPLRRPRPGEAGTTWICASCGSRYYAVLDEEAGDDLRVYVRPEALRRE